MSKLLVDIPYLEASDVTPNGDLSHTNGKPSIVMLQGNYCPHCTTAKPTFQLLPQETQNLVNVYTVQIDGDSESDRKAGSVLMNKHGINGIPAFAGFSKDGKFKAVHNGGRDLSSLKTFATSLLA
jgi:thiol-disulfide isomerase/thioredoxin